MPLISYKHITLISPDLLDTGSDRLRLALGNSWHFEQEMSPAFPGGIQHSLLQPYRYGGIDYTSADPIRELKAYRIETDPNYEPFGYPRAIESFEMNTYNVTMINQNAYVPNFKIPIRFYADAANSKGDLYWNKYWLGGIHGDEVFTPLINESTTFYPIRATICLPYWEAPLEKDDFNPMIGQEARFRTFGVKAHYDSYDEHVQSRIDYESELPETLLPNYNFTLDVLQSDYDFDTSAYTDYYGFPAYESGMPVSAGKYTPQEKNLRDWYFQDSLHTSRSAANYKNRYFGTHWPMSRESAARHQENIMFDQYYYQYYTKTRTTGWESTPTYFPANWRNQNLLASSNMYNVTVEFTPSKPEFFDTEGDLGLKLTGIPTFEHEAIESRGKNIIRDIIEKNEFSPKFLEILKDIDEGALPDFSTKNTKYPTIKHYGAINDELKEASVYVGGGSYETHPIAPVATQVDERSYKSFNWLDMLAYVYNNPTSGMNDNFIFLGPPEIRHHTTVPDNTTYRYIDTTSTLSVLDATMDQLGQLYAPLFEALNQNKYYTHSDLEFSSPSSLSATLNSELMQAINQSSAHPIAYRIDKFEATPEGRPTGDPIQKFWMFNSKNIATKMSLIDSQVKFGKHYLYRCTAYVAIISHQYRYSNLRLTKQIGKYDLSGTGVPDSYCVQFYDPYNQLTADQTFASKLSSPDVASDVTYQTTGLSEYNLVATPSQDLINYPQAADIFLNVQPCIKIVQIPFFEKTCGVYDNPPSGMSVEPFHFIDDSNRIGFSVKGDPYKPYFYPSLLKQSDKQQKINYLSSRELAASQYVDTHSRSPSRYLEMYRISKKPTSFYDFGTSMVSRIDLRIPNEEYNLKDYIAVDKIVPNKTYYYVFRFISENGMPSWPSSIIEARLVNDGGYIYSLFDHFDTSEFIKDPFANPTTSFKKLVHIEPNIQQLQFDTSGADFTLPANTQLDNVQLGVSEEKLWDKKFKIRLTSKKTGKKIDLNVTYVVDAVDMSSTQDSYLNPDDTTAKRTFIHSSTS